MPNSYAGKTERWTTLVTNTEPLLGSVPAAQELHSELKVSTTELGAMASRIQELLGEAHTLAKRRQDLARKVSEDATRLKTHLQAHLGLKNPELVKLGIRPQDMRRRGLSAKAKAAKALAEAKGSEGQSVSAEA
ncbi:MAG TPA: hypothetical protein VGS22_00635 [Thermoanaerobaculia bacterium]|nr:hypothetical protein [Thermoanaerobaculia bacterium]